MKLKYASKTEIPADQVESFIEFKTDPKSDAVEWVHKDYAEALKAQFRLQGDLSEKSERMDELSQKIDALKAQQEDSEREKMKGEGRYKEMYEDLEKRHEKEIADLKKERDDLVTETHNRTKKALVNELAAHGTKDTRTHLSRLIAMDLDLDEKGNPIVLDDDGKASSMTIDQYTAKLPERYPQLVAEVRSGGGNGKGGMAGGSGARKFEDYTPGELKRLRESDPAEYDRIRPK